MVEIQRVRINILLKLNGSESVKRYCLNGAGTMFAVDVIDALTSLAQSCSQTHHNIFFFTIWLVLTTVLNKWMSFDFSKSIFLLILLFPDLLA